MSISCHVLARTALVIEAIEYVLASAREALFGAEYQIPTLNECQCEFPDCIKDPFEIIRKTHGDERARDLEYQDDLECILSELESCLLHELRAQEKTLWDIQGYETGEESDNGEAVEGS
jgi:hypothetical protein